MTNYEPPPAELWLMAVAVTALIVFCVFMAYTAARPYLGAL